ncbi:Tetracycline resistance protein TetM from transposon TnFO1 [bioreactor metagenome]|uniref:Tetracycline resistance protein TetM from transposon TnFO1 n=1 Tax=bioreactor metagenome TaxID=1076179 RepID=A0A644YZT0_9ZZZZ
MVPHAVFRNALREHSRTQQKSQLIMKENIRNIVILAHADAGKTSITELMLFHSGMIKKPGSVDDGSTHTDFLAVERERGISVRSAHTTFLWNDVRINLVDTPGHVDFSADVERILTAVDGAVLVISAAEGIQAHTGTLWNALRARNIPAILFVNKLDRMGADIENVLMDIRKEWYLEPLCMQSADHIGTTDVETTDLFSKDNIAENIAETIVAGDEYLMEAYLDGAVPDFETLEKQLAQMVSRCDIYPVLFGSARLNMGIDRLLDAMIKYLPAPDGDAADVMSARVFGISYDKTMGKVAHVRLFGGSMSNRELVRNSTQSVDEKVVQLRRMSGSRFEELQQVVAGDIAGVCGFSSASVGDWLGEGASDTSDFKPLQMPLLTVRVKAVNEKEYSALAAALQQLCSEDPSLNFEWLRDEKEMNISVMGWIQMEVLERILLDRFGIAATFEQPTVIYKETPSFVAEGFVRYWMPKPCWAILKFRIGPGEPGSGVVYHSEVSVDDVAQKYQNEVEQTISASLKQGIKGWEVTDIEITLIEGEDHEVHSRPGDFVIATPMGIMNGLVNSGTTLLEPFVSFRIKATEELLGPVTSDITKMRGSFENPEMDNGKFTLNGFLPVATSHDYPVKLSSRSGGKASISTQFAGYRPCADELGVVRPYKGISPLDEAKWILKARGAMQ